MRLLFFTISRGSTEGFTEIARDTPHWVPHKPRDASQLHPHRTLESLPLAQFQTSYLTRNPLVFLSFLMAPTDRRLALSVTCSTCCCNAFSGLTNTRSQRMFLIITRPALPTDFTPCWHTRRQSSILRCQCCDGRLAVTVFVPRENTQSSCTRSSSALVTIHFQCGPSVSRKAAIVVHRCLMTDAVGHAVSSSVESLNSCDLHKTFLSRSAGNEA